MIPYGRQKISKEDVQAVVETLTSDFLTQGPKVHQFEQAIAAYCGAKNCAAICNGTAALHLAVLAIGIGPGDAVIVPTLSFLASANCVEFVGGTTIFVDIDPKTYNLDLNQVEKHLQQNPSIKAVIAVDFAGLPASMQELRKLADRYNIKIVEDACHAFGADYKHDGVWRKAGASTCADLTVFSFHPVKHLTTGEGGAILTNDDNLFQKVQTLRTHGIKRGLSVNRPWYYEMEELGYNYRITDMQCALGLSQLRHIDEWVQKRRVLAGAYNEYFKGTDIIAPVSETASARSSFHLYVIQLEGRDELYHYLQKHGVAPQIHYMPIHLQPYYYRKYCGKLGQLPIAEAYAERCISLPCFVDLDIKTCKYIADHVLEFVRQ